MSVSIECDVDDAAERTIPRDRPYPTSGTKDNRKPIPDEDDEKEEKESESDGDTESLQVEDMASWAGQPAIKGSTESMRMALLTLSLVGLQCVYYQ